ncbi:hypothetical protein TNCV_1679021 [Trichonephila clavipes]|nr:hypothetical protein TNCV_1679021 [Trichonephila clavipes]
MGPKRDCRCSRFSSANLFSDEAHFWLNGYVNKQTCRIWSETNPRVSKVFVKRFEETGKLKNRARAGRPCLKKGMHPAALLSKWKRLRQKQLQGPTVFCRSCQTVSVPPSSVHEKFFVESSAVPIQIAIMP